MDLSVSALARPLGPRKSVMVGTLLVGGGAAYCVLRDLLICDDHSLTYAAQWAAVTMLPWLAAFEVNKVVLRRLSRTPSRAAAVAMVLVLTMIVSGLLQWLVTRATDASLGILMRLHVVSHFSETIIVALRTAFAAHLVAPPTETGARRGGSLPVAPTHIRWLKSTGNYVEFRTDQRSHVCRMTLRQAQALLDSKQFVRISRSVIVNRTAVDPASRGLIDHVRLVDGSEHKVGNAYRAEIARLA